MNESSHPRRPVPWCGLDVFVLFLLYFVTVAVLVAALTQPFPETGPLSVGVETTDHPLTQLLRQGSSSPIVLLIAFFSGVLAAPIAEEFMFRLVLQGWLCKVFSDSTRRRTEWDRETLDLNLDETAQSELAESDTAWRPGLIAAVPSILATSLFFAVLHAGSRSTAPTEYLLFALLGVGIGNLLTFFSGLLYLRLLRKATWRDLGWDAEKLPRDLGLALAVFFLTVPAILVLHALIQSHFPDTVTDPIPLFLFSLVLGLVIHRTGRLTPCILMHIFLNGFSFAALALAIFY